MTGREVGTLRMHAIAGRAGNDASWHAAAEAAQARLFRLARYSLARADAVCSLLRRLATVPETFELARYIYKVSRLLTTAKIETSMHLAVAMQARCCPAVMQQLRWLCAGRAEPRQAPQPLPQMCLLLALHVHQGGCSQERCSKHARNAVQGDRAHLPSGAVQCPNDPHAVPAAAQRSPPRLPRRRPPGRALPALVQHTWLLCLPGT